MAYKTHKRIKDKMRRLFLFRHECAKRSPEYKEYCEFIESHKGSLQEKLKRANVLFMKYGVLPCAESQHTDVRMWLNYCYPILSPEVPDDALGTKQGFLEAHLENDEWMSLKVNIRQDKELVLIAVSRLIADVQRVRKIAKLPIPRKVHLNNFERYFAVYDLAQQRNHGWHFNRIALHLKQKGWYGNKTVPKVEALVRQDYRLACKLIGIPVKSKKKALKPRIRISSAQKHQELFRFWDKKLSAEGLGETEVGNRYFSPDGIIKKKMKVKLEPEVNNTENEEF